MELRFAFSDGYSLEDLRLFNILCARRGKVTRWSVPLLRLVLLAGGAFLFLTGILTLAKKGSVLLAVLYLLVGAAWMLLGLFRDRVNAWRSRRIMLRGVHRMEFTVTEDGIAEKTEFTNAEYTFEPDCALVFYKETYFVFFDKRHAVLLPLRCMTRGKAKDLEKFWEEKMGKPVEKY